MKGNYGRYSAFLVLWGILVWYLPWAHADQVYLHNGDRLTGKVLSMGKGRLRLRTEYAGELSIRWETIASLKTDGPVVLTLQGDEQLYGWFESDDEEDNVFLSEFGKQTIAPRRILAIRPPNEEERRRVDAFGKPALWKHLLEAGLQVRSGNVDTTDAIVGYQAQRESDRSEFEAELSGAYGETEGERTAQQARAGGRFDLLHTKRFFSFYLATMEHDTLEELNLRALQQAGVGYKFSRTTRTKVQGEVGFGMRESWFENDDTEIEPTGRVGAAWAQKLGEATELEVSAAFLPDLIDRGEYRMEAEASLSTPITNRFLLRFSLLDSFDSNPQPGVKNNDLTLLSSIAWTF